MKIAIPVAAGRLATHFGHCQEFHLVAVDRERGEILGSETLPAPPHQPGLLPAWLAERGAGLIIAGGMGRRAQDLFARSGIEVVVGAPPEEPESLARAWLEGRLEGGDNLCDH